MDPIFKSLYYLKLRNYEKCNEVSKTISNQYQKEKWYIICKSRTEESYIDFTEPDETNASDNIFEDSTISQLPRPGTSLRTSSILTRGSRPITQSGNSLSGYTHNSQNISKKVSENPTTSSTSRFTRLVTSSLAFSGDEPDITSINIEKFSKNPFLSRILIDYLLIRIRDPIRSVQLASDCSKRNNFNDWFWKNRLGRSYYQVGLLNEAEEQFKSSLSTNINIDSRLELTKIYIRLDQPSKALSELDIGIEQFPHEIKFYLCQGRIYEQLGDFQKSRDLWKKVLQIDQSSIEAISSLATSTFYDDLPETSLKFYTYLKNLGLINSSILNNIAISGLSSGNYNIIGPSICAALTLAETDVEKSDIWYNISHIGISSGDLLLATYALLISTSLSNHNGEAFNNLGLLELKNKNIQKSIAAFKAATQANPEMHEPWFNLALLYEKIGQIQEAYTSAKEAVRLYPMFSQAIEFLNDIEKKLK